MPRQLLKFFNSFAIVFFLVLFFHAQPAEAALIYRGVDVMKHTKDTLNNKPSDAQIEAIVSTIVNTIHPTHIAISVPLDDTSDFSHKWASAVHRHGVKVIFRGTWNGIEGIYNAPKLVGSSRIPAGSLASAPSDNDNSWLGKTYKYIINHPGLFETGDLWAPLPERTEGIFQDSTSFLSYGSPGIQANYATFFNDLKKVSDLAFARINKNVGTGFTANNFTEVASTWMPRSVFDTAGIISIDHYGDTHASAEMDADIRKIYNLYGKKVFLQEWGDYWNSNLSASARTAYLNSMYAVFQKLVNDGILIGFNYWGAWDNNLEGILKTTGPASYTVNDRGLILAKFFAANGSAQSNSLDAPSFLITPPPPPVPTSIPTPPAVYISSPAMGAIVSGTSALITATAFDDVAVAGVQFRLDGSNLGSEDTTAPYSISWDTTLVSNGSHTISATARDAAGTSTISEARIVTVNNTQANPPEPILTVPIIPVVPLPTPPLPILPTPTPTPPQPAPFSALSLYKDGTLILDRGVVYTIEYGIKRPIASAEVFSSLGYKWTSVIDTNIATIPSGEGLFDGSLRHTRGTIVVDEGTVYFLGKDYRYPYPSAEVFLSWDNQFRDIVLANSNDKAMPIGPIAVAKNQVLGASFSPLPFGTLIKAASDTVYLVFDGIKVYSFASEELFLTYGFTFDVLKEISEEELGNYEIISLQD